jgi:hypothetical protein
MGEVVGIIIPAPKIIEAAKGISYGPDRIGIDCKVSCSVKSGMALKLLSSFTKKSHMPPDFNIIIDHIDGDNAVWKKIKNTKKKEQAYSIKSIINKGVYTGIKIEAFTDTGILYAARTLAQALTWNDGEVCLPILEIYDWPDTPYRGQWGGNSNCDIAWTSQFKLNVLDAKVTVSCDDSGNPVVIHNDRLYDEAAEYGVEIFSTISHLEQISNAGFMDKKKGMEGVPSEERKKRSDAHPVLCMRSDVTRDMVYQWFRGIVSRKGSEKILVWLSEEETRCYCPRCKGEEPFGLEVQCLLDAYAKIKTEFPQAELNIMLSQGSFKVNEKIAAMLPPEVGLTYYDGGRTYDSGMYEMILPELEEYAKRGGNLGVYPQVTHSWRVVFPWTAPYFIRCRCKEFVDKKLERVIGYAIPSNRYHEFNIMALAEWLWNRNGRTEAQFAKAYARLNGMDENLFADFLKVMNTPAWELAQSRLLLRLMYNYPLVVRSSVEFNDHRFEMSEVIKIKNPGKLMKSAQEGLKIARKLKRDEYIHEAECVISGLSAYKSITGFLSEINDKKPNVKKLQGYYEKLRADAAKMYSCILMWSDIILMDRESCMYRVMDTASILLRVLDGFNRYLTETGFSVDNTMERVVHLGTWDESVFNSRKKGVLEFDITAILKKGGMGTYQVCLDFINSDSGTDVESILILEQQPAGGRKTVSISKDRYERLSVWKPWAEYRISVRKLNAGAVYLLHLDISGLENNRETCRGMAGIRKIL